MPSEPNASPATVLDRLRAFARTTEPSIFAALDGAELVERSDERLRIRVPQPFAARRLRERQSALDALAASFFGHATRVQIEDTPASGSAPVPGAAPSGETARQRKQEALNDPAVGRALDILGADIVEIRPLGGSR